MLSTSTSAINSNRLQPFKISLRYRTQRSGYLGHGKSVYKITVDVVFHVTKLPSPYVIYQRYQELIFASEIGPKRKMLRLDHSSFR